jgi:CheY-like chemotaxis protein
VFGVANHLRAKTGRALAARRFQVVLAEDGPRALALLAVRPPQVLITDVEMPGLDGLALTRTLRADPKAATLPVLMVSWPDEWLKTEAAEAGVTVLMTKPCADDELIAQVARLAGVALSE